MAGPLVVAVGEAAGAWTCNRLVAENRLARLDCGSCEHKGHVPHYKIRAAGRGDVPLWRLKLVCVGCGAPFPELSIVDPYRSALDAN